MSRLEVILRLCRSYHYPFGSITKDHQSNERYAPHEIDIVRVSRNATESAGDFWTCNFHHSRVRFVGHMTADLTEAYVEEWLNMREVRSEKSARVP